MLSTFSLLLIATRLQLCKHFVQSYQGSVLNSESRNLASRDSDCISNKTILQAEEYKGFQAANQEVFKSSIVCEPHLTVVKSSTT